MFCSHCRVGKLTLKHVPYIKRQSRTALVVDHIPAHICDTCGEIIYDVQALESLRQLLKAENTLTPTQIPF
jgi:YgiT-type zinc finger domain-containing protein